jgi:pyruvate dehydrogenase E2 component (dihydrolipoamide acetyltransferase)
METTINVVDTKPAFIDVGGRRIRHVIRRGPGDAGILVHGIGGNLGVWVMNQGVLAAKGRTVAAIDLPGHGESSKQLASGSLEELSSTVLDYMDAIGVERAHLVGHSMGGAVCLDVTRRAPTRVRSLTLLAPAGVDPPPNLVWVERLIRVRGEEDLTQVLQESVGDPRLIGPEIVADVLGYLRMEGAVAALSRILDGVFRSGVLDASLRETVGREPTLVVWGDRDTVNPPPEPAAMTRSGVEFHLLRGCGHQLPVEAATEVNRLVDEFLG